MTQIIKSRGISYENLCLVGRMIKCEYDCQVGDIIDEGFVYIGSSPNTNTCKKGDYTIIIPLIFIDITETHSDLSQYGFIKANKGNRWFRR